MQTIDQRVTVLENRVGEHNVMMTAIVDSIAGIDRRMAAFEGRVDRRFESIDRRFESIDHRFENIDRRFENIDRRFDGIDRKFEGIDRRFATIDTRFDSVDARLSKLLFWTAGIQVSVLLAIVAVVVRG